MTVFEEENKDKRSRPNRELIIYSLLSHTFKFKEAFTTEVMKAYPFSMFFIKMDYR